MTDFQPTSDRCKHRSIENIAPGTRFADFYRRSVQNPDRAVAREGLLGQLDPIHRGAGLATELLERRVIVAQLVQ